MDEGHAQKVKVYGVPRGGVYVAALLASPRIEIVEEVENADVIVDDIIQSGQTEEHHNKFGLPFLSLIDKRCMDWDNVWISFPWERMRNRDEGIEHNVTRILQHIGEDPSREGLLDTPKRVAQAYETMFGGYGKDIQSCGTIFTKDTHDEMVLVKDVEFYSTCEHHMLPFFGVAHIAYIPNKSLLGISKLARVLEIFARRLQIQERLCVEVTSAITDLVKPLGAACVLEAKHLCMMARGIEKQNSTMTTSSLVGVFKKDAQTRQEFMNLIK